MARKVLVADDSLKIQRELTQLLEAEGVEVVTVSNGEHAVRQLPKAKPDLVLADLFMPVRTGYEVCEYIKTNEEYSHIPVLLLASKMEPYDQAEAQRMQADGKVEKPFADTGAVVAMIQSHLQKVAAPESAAPIEEFAAAVPAESEPAPTAAAEAPASGVELEPEPEPFATRPEPVRFEDQSAPLGFSDMEEPAEATPAPVETAPAELEDVVDLSEATILTTAADLKQRIEEEKPPAEVERAESGLAAAAEPEAAQTQEETKIEQPELAEAWEMTGPEAGAPEIPSGAGWDSAWKDEGEAEAQTADTSAEEEVAEAQEAPAEEEPAPVAGEASASDRFSPEEFARAFGGRTAESAAEAVEEAPATEPTEDTAAPTAPVTEEEGAAASAVDPAVIDDVVNQVLERLSPQVMETIAREIVRPLAENLLKDKLKD